MSDVWSRLAGVFSDCERALQHSVYVYRVDDLGRPMRPYLERADGLFLSDTQLLDYLQRCYGSGDYQLLVRIGAKMIFSGVIRIA